ncbi:MAG: efflux RND transporter periplasmic adaptor subunit [Kiloniellales bacterium]|nr:efflux RND transporter periplasmic adaptor subunit [Kiloniellales bacterium]MDJ0969831.1 efflux RND transporter periplasmic adaptor subunit [Kiloniellales bacterium]
MALRLQIGLSALLAALVAAGWLWLSLGGESAESREPNGKRSAATLVQVEALSLAADRVTLRVVGTGEALRSAALYPQVTGEVVEVLFKAEQRVEKGAPLLRLDDEDERLAVRLAQVTETEARRLVKRYEKLARSGNVSTVTLQTANAELESASLRLAQAEAALRDRTLYAPFDGVIGLTDIDPGDRVTDETLVATLDDRSVIQVKFTVPEDYAGRLGQGNPIAVRPWSLADRELRGTISALDSRIDPLTRSLRVEARIANPEESIRPGTSFDVRLDFTGAQYPSVPEVSVLWSRDGAYLWRVRDGRAEKVFITMVRRNRGRVLVEGPLEAGDLIVVEGVQGLRDGQAVEPRPFAEERNGAPRPSGEKDPA